MVTIANPHVVNSWVPIQYNPNLVTDTEFTPAIEKAGTRINMESETIQTPRLIGGKIGGGDTLVANDVDGDTVTMYSYLYNNIDNISEAKAEDTYVDVLAAHNRQFLKGLAVRHDNACFGVSGARSTVATDLRPYDSVLQVLSTTDAGVGYTAGANIITQAGALTYQNMSDLLSKIEVGDFATDSDMVLVAHPFLKGALRTIIGGDGHPIFQAANGMVLQDSVFGHPIFWTRGAQVTTNFGGLASSNKKLLIAANKSVLMDGHRVDPQARFIPASINTTSLTHSLQHRARKGFVVTAATGAAAVVIG